MNDVATNPFFWAFLSASMIAAGDGIVSNVLPRSRTFGALVVGTFMLGRTVLVLPLCPQPRFEIAGLHVLLGAGVLGLAGVLLLPAMRVGWSTGPVESEELRTTGVYGLVRHPGYLANVLLGLGWSILFQSTIGVVLTVFWWLAFYLHTLIEEKSLLATYGSAYASYKNRVRGRIIPGLPL